MVTSGSQPHTMIGTSIVYPCFARSCAAGNRSSSGMFRSACTAVGCSAQYASVGVILDLSIDGGSTVGGAAGVTGATELGVVGAEGVVGVPTLGSRSFTVTVNDCPCPV